MKTNLSFVLLSPFFALVVCASGFAQETSALRPAQLSTVTKVDPSPVQATTQQTPPSKEPNRMDETGCCVLKKSKYKPEWQFNDGVIRRQCIQDARGLAVDYDFYKNAKCDDVKKKINDGTAIPN